MRLFILVFLFLSPVFIHSQAELEFRVTDAGGSSTCRDLFFNAQPMYQVNIDNKGWETYPRLLNCYNDFGTVQFTFGPYDCTKNVKNNVDVCIKVFDNDASVFDCNPIEDCAVEICQNIKIIPALDYPQRHRIETPTGGASEGWVEIEFLLTGSFDQSSNDHICGALELGTVDFGETLGDASAGGYENICAELGEDANPQAMHPDGWYLHRGVWFSFETGANPSGALFLNMLSDPLNLGDPLNLQGAIFTSDNDACEGDLTVVAVDWDPISENDTVRFYCPEPNTKYYILIDGIWTNPEMVGHFGLEIIDPGIEEVADLLCDNIELGAIPPGGFVESQMLSNFCLTNDGDPLPTRFVSDKSVWLSFVAPATGHVLIEGTSEKQLDPIDLEMAVFESDDNTCSGNMNQIGIVTDPLLRDEELELSCLTPGDTYFILVDGGFRDREGMFEIKVTELFDDTPITNQEPVLCVNETIQVGNNIYDANGFYVDTILLGGGCDSVVYTNLTVLDEIFTSIEQTIRANDLGSNTGAAEVTATGGSGNFSYEWSDGQRTAQAMNLEGGENYCVTVTDNTGTGGHCPQEICIYVEYITPIIPTFSTNDVRCFGESNGSLNFSVNNGEPPYSYRWSGNSFNDNGTIGDDEPIQVNDLPAGIYEVTVTDAFIDTIFQIEVIEPTLVEISVDEIINAACFGYCDGSISASGIGGVGNYDFAWQSGTKTDRIEDLCAGIYGLTLTDGNGCETNTSIPVQEPPEFIATGIEDNGVTCLGWTDGAGSISTNGNPTNYNWQNGANTQAVTDLGAGDYSVTVTNSDGCFDTTMVTISEPLNPYLVEISVDEPIVCKGETNGVLMSTPTGGTTVDYTWSTNENTENISELGAGWYFVTVTSDTKCEAVDSILLTEPDEIFATPEGNQLTCLDPDDGGVVTVLTTTGGMAPYQYSIDGTNFTADQNIGDLFSGDYDLIVQDVLGCEREFPFSIIPPPDINVNLPAEMEIDLGDEIRLDALSNNPRATFEWSNPDIPCATPDCKTLEFQPLVSETLQVIATDSTFFCVAKAEIAINVLKKYKVFIPSGFSPNNDGVNDLMGIYGGKDVAMIKNFKVFDRYGSNIYSETNFEANDNTIGWDGSWKGQDLDPGVYVYFAEIEFINGEVEIFKGDVTIAK